MKTEIIRMLEKQEAQNKFISYLADKFNISEEEAFKKKCLMNYQELKELIKEYESEVK